jgi:cytidyltransferase-like protein
MPAIFVGRFQPFHKGHLKAIRWILKREKEIFIVIGSSQESFTKIRKRIKKGEKWKHSVPKEIWKHLEKFEISRS